MLLVYFCWPILLVHSLWEWFSIGEMKVAECERHDICFQTLEIKYSCFYGKCTHSSKSV